MSGVDEENGKKEKKEKRVDESTEKNVESIDDLEGEPETIELSEEPINLEAVEDFYNENLFKPFNPKKYKAEAAKWVAKSIVIIFGATLGIIFLFYIIIAFLTTFTQNPHDPVTHLQQYIETFILLIEATSGFASAIFAPLLAFILGYYFGTNEDKE
ncbi:MAG: hypothetical protein NXI08_13000 [bacterium]|nr:hypothetical protein [bacterium]